jgi:two-component system alkaline phosphatase synthesis response regulator PhoP
MTRFCLVVEDESPLGEMIRDNLVADGHDADLVTDGDTAAERIARGGIDLVVLDVMLPGRDGFTVLREMRARGDATPVLVLSARSADQDRIRGLELRADDYLTKPFVLRELLLRVRALLRRAPATVTSGGTQGDAPAAEGGATLEIGTARIDLRAHMANAHDGEKVVLPESGVRLLRMLCGRAGEAISRREILDHLYGPATPTTARTLDNLVAQLRRVFEPDSRHPRHLHTVRGVGYRFTFDPEQTT